MWALEREITTGYSGDIFGPHEPLLRWHLAVFLWRYQGNPEPVSASNFADVQDRWYSQAVNWMSEAGIASGTDAGRFDPDVPVTRAQAVTFLWRMKGQPAANWEAPLPFDDVGIDAYYHDAAHWAAQVGLTQGVGEREFGGELNVDRAQAVTFLHRYDMLSNDPDSSGAQDSADSDSEVSA